MCSDHLLVLSRCCLVVCAVLAVLTRLLVFEVYSRRSRLDEQFGEFHDRSDSSMPSVAVSHNGTKVVHPLGVGRGRPVFALRSLSSALSIRRSATSRSVVEQPSAERLMLLPSVKLLGSEQLIYLARYGSVWVLQQHPTVEQ